MASSTAHGQNYLPSSAMRRETNKRPLVGDPAGRGSRKTVSAFDSTPYRAARFLMTLMQSPECLRQQA